MLTNEESRKQQELAEYLLKNKLISSTNFLNYTNLTYQDIISAINAKISSDSRFDNFIIMHDIEMNRLSNNKKNLSSMGI